jgi:hypothetical protein
MRQTSPISTEQFLTLFVSCNNAIWPMQVAAYLLGCVALDSPTIRRVSRQDLQRMQLSVPRHVSNFLPSSRSLTAGFCGSAAHSGLMFLKSQFDLLPSFHPYEDLQRTLSELVGSSVHPWVPWALSFLNGSIVLGFLFGRTYYLLPGRSGAAKGFIFGVLGWIVMGLLFFPMLGRGAFASQVGLGFVPAFFSLLMVLSYSVIMGIAYSTMTRRSAAEP